jgi:hypothetical protein
MDAKAWCDQVAEIAVDQLVYDGLCKPEDFQSATAIVAEEIYARLCVGDVPPAIDPPEKPI